MDGNMENTMEQVAQYYDHYKDTFEQQKAYLARRDHLTLLLLLLAIILIGLLVDPSNLGEKFNIIIGAQVKDLRFDLHFINTGVILVTFWYLLQYYMVVLQVEKMYKYISECEQRLMKATPLYPINREGAYYLKSYPWLKNIADYIFVLGFPLGYIVLSVIKITNECVWTTPLKYVDIFVLCLIIFFSLLYISNRKLHEDYWNKNNYDISFYKRLIGYLGVKKYKIINSK